MGTSARPADGAVTLAELREFASFPSATQRYIRRSLDIGLRRRDAMKLWSRDLVEEAIRLEKERRRDAVREAASKAAMERLLTALVGDNASEATREAFRQRIVDNSMNDTEVEIEVR